MSECRKLMEECFPTRKKQLAYEARLLDYLTERGWVGKITTTGWGARRTRQMKVTRRK